ncbi:hypothetical protein M758_11G094500 [Ceratodon purpureus]|uniref:NAD(P)-binding domain-containing protein n=1 Tax=Ceratodon purpureus TaxID=3225 RepID=A0A8T0GEB9_CERPU|nr:hypothetical protein KC19_11G097600 [Ceratodon purpureus]KAG0601227.1 hypothetical protein M758_11G094500 [Ceratodon purpureus]
MAGRGGKQALQHLHHLRDGAVGASRAHYSVSTASRGSTAEAEVMEPKSGERKKVLVLGGNGYVGTHICKEALSKGVPVVSLSRSGRPKVAEPWSNDVEWVKGDLFQPSNWRNTLDDVSAVISCVGGFGSNEQMQKINGVANVQAIRAAAEAGVKRFVYISAHDFGLPSFVLRGYYAGKRAAEDELLSKFPYSGVILRPGFIHGVRQVGRVKLPLNAIGSPLELVLKNVKPLSQLPLVGNLLVPPVKVVAVAKAAVRSATDNAVPPGIMDVWGIMRLSGD